MFSRGSKRAKIEMIAHERLNAKKLNLASNEVISEPLVDKTVWLEENQIDAQLEALVPRFLMVLIIGLVSSLYQAVSHRDTNLQRMLRHIQSFCQMSCIHSAL
jgi:hypothetical protein